MILRMVSFEIIRKEASNQGRATMRSRVREKIARRVKKLGRTLKAVVDEGFDESEQEIS